MLGWLRRFFYSDDPEVKVVAALNEIEAKMWRELLAGNGVPAAYKNITGGYLVRYGSPTTFGNHYDLFVRRSDLEQAREVLAPLIQGRSSET